jgi:hypothetical protein
MKQNETTQRPTAQILYAGSYRGSHGLFRSAGTSYADYHKVSHLQAGPLINVAPTKP